MTIKVKKTHNEYHVRKYEWASFEEENGLHYLKLKNADNPMIFNDDQYIKHVLKKDGTLIIHSHDTN